MRHIVEDHHSNCSDPYFVGVDGGGSKTLAVVVDAQGCERGRGLAGSGNQAAVGVEQAVSQLRAAVEEAMQMAGCSLPPCAAWLGVAGIDTPRDYELLFPHLRSLAETVRLTNDAELVLGALDQCVGVALIAGTGSIAIGRDACGAATRAAGWGHLMGEEGSGYEIGRQALQAAVRAADGRGQPTTLLSCILEHWQLQDVNGILGEVYPDIDNAKIARLSSIVLDAAEAGDNVARKIIRQSAAELALMVTTVSDRLHFPGGQIPLALGGGLLVHGAAFRAQVIRRLRHRRSIGQVAIVAQPALIAARAAIQFTNS